MPVAFNLVVVSKVEKHGPQQIALGLLAFGRGRDSSDGKEATSEEH